MDDGEIKRIVLRQTIKILAQGIKQMLEENLVKDPKLVEKEMERARSFRKLIESYGFPVIITSIVDPKDPTKVKVSVEVFEPKANMTPEEQKIYDNWFTQATGLPSLTLP